MGKCIASGYIHSHEITICDNCFHKDVCDTGDYLDENICSDFINKNTAVELPCKVGDTVYFIKAAFTFLPEPCAGMVRSITLTEKEMLLRTPDRTFGIDKIGKTVFLTLEEAEEALKGAEE